MKYYLNINGGKPIVYAKVNNEYVGVNLTKDEYELTDVKLNKVEYDFICTFSDAIASLGISEGGEYRFPLPTKPSKKAKEE